MRPHATLLLLAALSALPVAACAEAALASRPVHLALQLWDSPALTPEGFAVPQSPALSPAPTALRQLLWGRWAAAGGMRKMPARSRAPVCQYRGCPKRATFGQRACNEGGGGRAFCAEHRSAASHVDLNRKRCKHAEGCAAFAYYRAAPLAVGDAVAAGDAPAPLALLDATTAPIAGGRFACTPVRRPASCSACPAPAAPPV